MDSHRRGSLPLSRVNITPCRRGWGQSFLGTLKTKKVLTVPYYIVYIREFPRDLASRKSFTPHTSAVYKNYQGLNTEAYACLWFTTSTEGSHWFSMYNEGSVILKRSSEPVTHLHLLSSIFYTTE